MHKPIHLLILVTTVAVSITAVNHLRLQPRHASPDENILEATQVNLGSKGNTATSVGQIINKSKIPNHTNQQKNQISSNNDRPYLEFSEPPDDLWFETDEGELSNEHEIALQTVDRPVDWLATRNHPEFDSAPLTTEIDDKIKSSPVPVLLPANSGIAEKALLKDMHMTIGDAFYAANLTHDGVLVQIVGSSRHAVAASQANLDVPPWGEHQNSISREEGIVELDFTAFGVSYNVVIECIESDNDPRCLQDRFITDISDRLRVVRNASQ